MDKGIRLLENVGCISNPWAAPVIIVPKKPDPFNLQKQHLHSVSDYQSLNRSINTAQNNNSVKSYYPLPNITYLLERLWMCAIFFWIDLRSGYYHIGLTPEAKPKTAFATMSGKWHWNMAPFGICLLPGVFCYFMLQILSGLDFCFPYFDDILAYSASLKKSPTTPAAGL